MTPERSVAATQTAEPQNKTTEVQTLPAPTADASTQTEDTADLSAQAPLAPKEAEPAFSPMKTRNQRRQLQLPPKEETEDEEDRLREKTERWDRHYNPRQWSRDDANQWAPPRPRWLSRRDFPDLENRTGRFEDSQTSQHYNYYFKSSYNYED